MKNINFLSFVFLISLVTIFTSCKKEDQIKQNLWSNGGKWNIESIYAKQVSSNTSDNFEETIFNYGTYTFNQDGSGSFMITVDGDLENGIFTYSNTEDKLTLLILNDGPIVFDILEWEKDKMKIFVSDDFISGGNSITYSETLSLKKL